MLGDPRARGLVVTPNGLVRWSVARLLLTWIGTKDFEGAAERTKPLGPVAEAVAALSFDEIHILSDHSADKTAAYVAWLTAKTKAAITVHPVKP